MILKLLKSKDVRPDGGFSKTEGIHLAYYGTGDRNDIRETEMKTIFSSLLDIRRFQNRRTRLSIPSSL